MNENLYYCREWKHKFYKEFDICVSDFAENIRNRNGGGLLQIHCVVIHNNKVVRGLCTKDLSQFEKNVRMCVRMFIDTIGTDINYYDYDEVRIWYYNSDDREFDTNDIPLRLAITFHRPTKLNGNEKEIEELKVLIYNELYKLIDKVINADFS